MTPSALMQAMGSKEGFDPMPPSQYKYHLTSPVPWMRAVAWIQAHTLAQGHRSPFAIDQAGNALMIQDLANDCFNGHWPNAAAAFEAAESRRLVKRDPDGKLLLEGDVVPPDDSVSSFTSEGQKPLCQDFSALLEHYRLPGYLLSQVQQLAPEKQDEFAVRYSKHKRWQAQTEAEALAAARLATEECEIALFQSMGLVKRLSKKTRPLTGILKLQVIIDADNLCVQDSKCPLAGLVGETQPSVYIEENDAVQVFASLLTSEKTENIEVKSMAAEPPASVSQSTLEPAEGTDRQTGATPEEVEQMLVRCLGHRLTGKPTAKLSNEILRNLQGAPLQDLAHRINDRLRKITSYGMVANLATDCAFSFHQVEQERAAREQPRSIALGLVDAETRLRLATEYEAYRDREIQSRIVSMGEAYGALVARVTREVKMKFPLLTSAQMRENVDVVVKHEIADELNLLSLDDYSREHTGG